MTRPSLPELSRRDALKVAGGAGVLGVGAVAGDRLLAGEDAPTTGVADDRARELAERFAPDLYYDEYEEWYVTDPRPYETERDGEVVVDGKAAYDGYSREFDEAGEPPRRVVFYHVKRYEDSPLAVVQYWLYSAFDQFTTNFHWHDWELLQVFVDLETEAPQLYVASAHSRSVPNNEFLDPDGDRRPAILPELGSHSSGLAVNERRDSFQRLPLEDDIADITNGVVDALGDLPVAYGLPRDEGLSLPFVVPELDGQPLYDHPDLPNVTREHLVDPALTVRSYRELAEPPGDLPARGTGLQFGFHGDADHRYDLEPVAALTHVESFVGPQLSFEFDVPRFAEDAIAGHITATATPWQQERFRNPASDVTDPAHRAALAERYDAVDPGGPLTQVVGRLRRVESDEDAPEDSGVRTTEAGTGGVALVESDPVAVPSFAGVVVARGLPEGEHRLTVNAPGMAPYSERVAATEGETTTAGADGDVALVARKDAVKLAVDGELGDSIARVAVEDDFGGRIVDVQPEGDREGVYVHGGGAYTVGVRDPDDEPGAHRFNPDADESRREVVARTGKASLASFVASVVTETGRQAPGLAGEETGNGDSEPAGSDDSEPAGWDDSEPAGSDDSEPAGSDDGDGDTSEETDDETPGAGAGTGIDTDVADPALRGLLRALSAIATAAERAAERAENGDAGGADTALERILERIESTRADLEAADHDDDVAAVTARRLEQAERRASQALETGKVN